MKLIMIVILTITLVSGFQNPLSKKCINLLDVALVTIINDVRRKRVIGRHPNLMNCLGSSVIFVYDP